MKLDKRIIPFDFKVTKLEHSHWDRSNEHNLAKELIEQQGSSRINIDNRIIIAFDKSTNSSVTFFNQNRSVITTKILQMLKDPEQFWHQFEIDGKKILVCLILIKENEYQTLNEIPSEHPIGDGIREPDKAEWSHEFLHHMAWISDGLITPNENPYEKGVDGYITLPLTLIVKVSAFEKCKFLNAVQSIELTKDSKIGEFL